MNIQAITLSWRFLNEMRAVIRTPGLPGSPVVSRPMRMLDMTSSTPLTTDGDRQQLLAQTCRQNQESTCQIIERRC